MRLGRPLVLGFCLLAAWAVSSHAQTVPESADSAKRVQKCYYFAEVEELRRYPLVYAKRNLRLLDCFDAVTQDYPPPLREKGYTPEKFVAFHTAPPPGSEMTCYLPKGNAVNAAILEGIARSEPVEIFGRRVRPIALDGSVCEVLNGKPVFLVDRIFGGWDLPVWRPSNAEIKSTKHFLEIRGKTYMNIYVDEMRASFPRSRVGLSFLVYDLLEGTSRCYPDSLKRLGFTPDKYVEFQTSSSWGSGMLCYLPAREAAGVAVLTRLSPFDPVKAPRGGRILMLGTVHSFVGSNLVFIVDKLYAGWNAVPEEGAENSNQ